MYNLKPPTTYSRHVVYLNDLTNPYHLKFSRSYPRVYQAFQPNDPDGKSVNYAPRKFFSKSAAGKRMYNLSTPTTYSRHVVHLNDLTNPYHLKFSRSYPRVYQAFQPNDPDGKSINYAIKRLFHGSNQLVRFPLIKCSKQGNDFGLGFYTTSDEEQARRFAKKIAERHGGQDRVSSYLFDDSILRDYKVLNFPMSNLRWLDYITINRMQGKPQHVADLKTFIDFNNLGELLHQQPDYVSGPIADGQLFNILEQYMKGEIWPSDALKALHSEKYTDQIVFKNQDLLNKLKFDEKNSH